MYVSTRSRSKRRPGRRVLAARACSCASGLASTPVTRPRASRQHGGAVALAAGHVDHPQAGAALGDPPVHGQVPAVPVVLLGHVRQRALAGQLERRHAGRLVLLYGLRHRRGSLGSTAPPADAGRRRARIRDANVRYHDVAAEHYDSKWGIDYGEIGAGAGAGQAAQGARPDAARGGFGRALEIGAGTGYFTLNLLRAGRDRARRVATDISPGCCARWRHPPSELGLEVETVACDAEALPFEDDSFDLVLGHAVLHHLPDLDAALPRVPPRAAPRAACSRSGRAVAPRRPPRGGAEARRAGGGAAVAALMGARSAAAPTAPRARRRGGPARAGRGRARLHARPTCRATPAAPGSTTCASAARSWWRRCSAGPTARSRRPPSPPTCRGPGTFAFRGYLLLQRARPLAAGAAAAGGALLQPAGLRARAGLARSPGTGAAARTSSDASRQRAR